MTTVLSGPWVEPQRHNGFQRVDHRPGDAGSHYSVWHMDVDRNGRPDAAIGMESLRAMFPNGEADDMNFVLFSTSGVHGSYTSIEDIKAGFDKYGDDFEPEDNGGDWPEGWHGRNLTVLVIQPRLVCMKCGNVKVTRADIPYLKNLRASSWEAVQQIGLSI